MAFASINQASVGGGSSNALAIQSDGIFMPRLSTGQRTALALTTSDAGLTVYDFTLNNLFIWNGAAWESIPGSGDAGANGSVQYNDNGIVSGATNFVWDKVNGRVGIGGTPESQLDVRGLIAVRGTGTFPTTGVGLEAYYSSANTSSFLQSYDRGGSAFANLTYNALSHVFQLSSGVGMTLNSTGLLVGTTTNTNSSRVFARGTGGATTLAIQSSTGDTANPGLLVGKFDNDSTTSQILVRFTIANNTSGSGQITSNGANAAAFGTFSDSRLKKNILSLPSQLANILSLRPVEFDYKDGSGHQIGFVAQEMQGVYSDAVGEQNGFLTVTGWSKTEARLVSAIKELAAKVQALEAKLA